MATTSGRASAQVGVTGLAVMGSNLARNLARHGFVTAVHNRSFAKTQTLIAEHGADGTFVPSESMADFVASLARPRTAIVMVKAGAPTDAVIEELAGLMDPGDIVIDGGNAHFADTRRREEDLRGRSIDFVGCGISGGEEGALGGPSIMPGGSKEAYATVGPILETISAHVDGEPCCTHIGSDGAGHFVKMVHNGIEYADMQLIGEGYDLLRRGAGLNPERIADIFAQWNSGELDSFLIEITADVLRQVDAKTGEPLVDVIADAAAMKGTGTWTVQTALDLAVPVTGIAEAVFARGLSSQPTLRSACQDLPGPSRGGDDPSSSIESYIENVRTALYASKIVAYAQGLDLIGAGADRYGWDIDLGAVARIWRGGCIIRAAFLNRITDAYAGQTGPVSLLTAPYFTDAVAAAQDSWRRVIAGAVERGIPVPGFAAAVAYYDGLRSDRLPASLVQAQRDFFGAHTYRRIDKAGVFHTLWSGDRSEVRTDS